MQLVIDKEKVIHFCPEFVTVGSDHNNGRHAEP